MALKYLHKYVPITKWLPAYQPRNLLWDLLAGLTVGAMNVPQGMSYAVVAGMDPMYGLYAAMLPPIPYALLGSSPHLVVGPTGIMSILVASTGDPHEAFLLAFLAGLILFLSGVFQVGFLADLISFPVVVGFTAASGLIIAGTQFNTMFGITASTSKYLLIEVWSVITNIESWNWEVLGTFLVGAAFIFAMQFVIPSQHRWIPVPLILVTAGIVVSYFVDLPARGFKLANSDGAIPQGFPSFTPIPIRELFNTKLIVNAFVIAGIGFMEAISVGKTFAVRGNYEIVPRQELVGLGAANVFASFFGCLPVTGSFTRTAVNANVGAKTHVSALVGSALVAFTLVFLYEVLGYLPMVVLSSIIVVAAASLVHFGDLWMMWRCDKVDFWICIVTFLLTVVFSTEIGLGISLGISLLVAVIQTARPRMVVYAPNTSIPLSRRDRSCLEDGFYGDSNSHSHASSSSQSLTTTTPPPPGRDDEVLVKQAISSFLHVSTAEPGTDGKYFTIADGDDGATAGRDHFIPDGVLVVRVDDRFYFANSDHIALRLRQLVRAYEYSCEAKGTKGFSASSLLPSPSAAAVRSGSETGDQKGLLINDDGCEDAEGVDGMVGVGDGGAGDGANDDDDDDDCSSHVRVLVVEGSGVNDIDTTGLRSVDTLREWLETRGCALVFANVKPNTRHAIQSSYFCPVDMCGSVADAIRLGLGRHNR
eukprot:TRINITY_DN6331_c0_g1_i1.p1 TRINITY_DN6331_c0_g1~~TRINITY_DN6331_c0_g1_i1.p1  ORF type:complete len:704 (+),score=136.56 TRINITY_DN6331_c0_g1_i1:191-2302(+)